MSPGRQPIILPLTAEGTKQPAPPPNEIKRPVLAANESKAVIRHVHQTACHPNLKNTLKLIRDRFWWKILTHDVTNYVTTYVTTYVS